MNRNLLTHCAGLGAMCLALASAHAQSAAPSQNTVPPSSAARATEPGVATPGVATPAAGQAGGPSMTPAAGDPAAGSGSPAKFSPAGSDNGMLPPPQQQGGVTYITGGFADDQSQAFKAAIPQHAVAMVFSEAGGAYLADIPVQIKGADKAVNLDIKATGPYLLLDLPDGKYTAQATYNGKSQTKEFSVAGNKGQRIGFTW